MDSKEEGEEALLRSVALQNAKSILLARQQAEQALREAKAALERKTRELAHSLSIMRTTLESTTDGILVTDNRTISAYNQKYVDMWRLPAGLIERRDHRELIRVNAVQLKDPDLFVARIRAIDSESPPESFDVLEFEDGRIFERYSTIQVVSARQIGRVWSFRDITERRRAAVERENLLERERAARAQAERMSALKDEFLATLSHELRTPLSAILGWSQVLRLRRMSAEELEQGLHAIERNARAQIRLIEDLLDMSRITSGKLRLDVQPVDPATIIEAAIETVRPAAEAKGIRLRQVLDPVAGPVSGDPNRLQQVVWNLLSNAIKFTGRGGQIQIALERVNSHIEISVADTGIGIDPAFLPHVFERFRQADASSTRQFAGLGLGLSIVKHLVELHGGMVRASSQGRGKGATFAVHLPLTILHDSWHDEDRVHPKAERAVSLDFARADLSGLRILVVDDEADAREVIRRVLVECRAEVLVAGTAEAALDCVRRERPDVLVSDIGMPEVDGYELLRRIRALGHSAGGRLPAIALTAFARSEDRTRALRAGFLVHVSKPVEPSELVATVASVSGRPAGHSDA